MAQSLLNVPGYVPDETGKEEDDTMSYSVPSSNLIERFRRLSSRMSYTTTGSQSLLTSVCSQMSQQSRSIRFQPPKDGASILGTTMILSHCILGVGLLNFPRAYGDAGGLIYALPTQMVCLSIIVMGLMALAHCSARSEAKTLQEAMHYYCGNVGLLITNLFIIFHNFGTCVTFLIVIADQVDQFMSAIFGTDFCNTWYLSRTFTLPVISIALLFPLCFIKEIYNYNWISYVGMLTIIYTVFFIIYEYFVHSGQFRVKNLWQSESNHWTQLFKVVPTLLFSYEVHIEVVPMYQSMKTPGLGRFSLAVVLSMLISTCVYTAVGVFCLLTFGLSMPSDLMNAYGTEDSVVLAAMAMQIIKSITTYPIIMFCTRLVIDDVIVGVSHERWTEPQRRYFGVVLVFMCSLIVALFVPSIGGMIVVLGISGVMFVFIFPGLAYVKEFNKWRSAADVLRCLVGAILLVFGAFIGGITIFQTVARLTRGEFSVVEVFCVKTKH